MSSRARLDNMILEFVEVSIHQLLFVNNIYPSGIFTRNQKYNTPVQVSNNPLVNNYIELSLKTAQELIHQNALSSIVLMFCCDEKPIKKIVFDISTLQVDVQLRSVEFDVLETGLRDAFLRLSVSDRHLSPLPKESTFKILLGTKEQNHVAMSTDSTLTHNQDFPWVRSETHHLSNVSNVKPLSSLEGRGISFQIYAVEKDVRSCSPDDTDGSFLLDTPS